MKVFKNKYYILGFISLLIMGGVVIYAFRTIFSSLSLAFEVETEIPESELRINKQNLDKAYGLVYESEPTMLDVAGFSNLNPPSNEEGEGTEETATIEETN